MNSNVNIPELRKAVEWVEEQAELARRGEPSEWNQRMWWIDLGEARKGYNYYKAINSEDVMLPNTCGTTYCVAGHITMQHGGVPMRHDQTHYEGSYMVMPDGTEVQCAWYAQDVLGLTAEQAAELFEASNSSAEVRAIAERIAGEPL